jgi:hypothetical protein
MNEEMTAPAMLEAAARLVSRALDKLDVEQIANCERCRSKRFRNPKEAQVFKNLRNVPHRLTDEAGVLKGSAGRGEGGLRLTLADERGEGAAREDT